MLKCKIKRNGIIKVEGTGSAQDLMAETAAVIKEVYASIKEKNPEAAAGYKSHLIVLLLDPNSPVWKCED